jgi:hypothetical protein
MTKAMDFDRESDPARRRVELSRRDALVRAAAAVGAGATLLGLLGCESSGSRSDMSEISGGPPRLPQPRYTGPRARVDAPAPKPTYGLPPGVIERTAWANAAPIPSRMERMLPVQRITLHHDGMPPVSIRSRADAARRLEQIRLGHLGRGFGDIGYHFIVDPQGNVWQGRPLQWQGAHVKDQNPGNLGILCLGNFEVQRPTQAQLATLRRFVASQMATYNVTTSRVHTHKELAQTACPGRNLQPAIVSMRRNGLG